MARRGRQVPANLVRVWQSLAGADRGGIGGPRPQAAVAHGGRPDPHAHADIRREPRAGPDVPIQVRERGMRAHAAEVVRRRLQLLTELVGGDAARAGGEAGHAHGLVVGGGSVEVLRLHPQVAQPRPGSVGPEAVAQHPTGMQAVGPAELVDPVVAAIRPRAVVALIPGRLRHRCIPRIDELVAHAGPVVGQPGHAQGPDRVQAQLAAQIPPLSLRRTWYATQRNYDKPGGRDLLHVASCPVSCSQSLMRFQTMVPCTSRPWSSTDTAAAAA